MRTACRVPSEGVELDHLSVLDFDCGLNVSGTLDVRLVIQLMAPHDIEVNKLVQSALQELEEGLYRLLIKAQVAGELPWRHDPHQLAHFLVATLVGIRVLARSQQDRRVLEDVVKTTLSVFET